MGLNIFDKLFDTAVEDIREVSVLIKNFKKTDFTTELADKGTQIKDEKSALKELQQHLNSETKIKEGIETEILDLTRQLAPIDSTLDIDKLDAKKKDLTEQIEQNDSVIGTKENNIQILEDKVAEISQSIDDKKIFGGVDIETAYSNYQEEQKKLVDATKVFDIAKEHLNSAEETITHLDNHKYDPNCEFCCDNTFVKNEMRVKEFKSFFNIFHLYFQYF